MNFVIDFHRRKNHSLICQNGILMIISLIVICSITTDIYGQQKNALIPYRTGALFGFVNKDFKQIIPPNYDGVDPFNGNVAVVKVFNKYGIINKEGKELTPFKYDWIFNEGHQWIIVRNGGTGSKKYGLINDKGTELIPVEYDDIEVDSNSYLNVVRNNLSGLMDTSGRILIPAEYSKLNIKYGVVVCYKNNAYGALTISGKIIVPFEYDNIIPAPDGNIAVLKQNKYGWVDYTGRQICKPNYDFFGYFADGNSVFSTGGKYGFMDINGREIVPSVYEGMWDFSNGRALVKQKGLYGYVDIYGKPVTPVEYEAAWPFKEGRARVHMSGKCAYIDSSGKKITSFKFTQGSDFNQGLAIVSFDNKKGFINLNGDIVYSDECSFLGNFRKGLSLKGKIGKYGMIDRSFNEIIPAIYDTIIFSHGNFIIANQSGQKVIYNMNGKVLAGKDYDEKHPANAYFIRVNKGDKKGLMDKNGNEIVPCEYKYVYTLQVSEGIASYQVDKKYGYIDTNGRIILPPEYDWCIRFHNGFGTIEKDNKDGFVNSKGKIITPLKYVGVRDFESGFAEVRESYMNDFFDYIDTNGRELIAPYKVKAEKKTTGKGQVLLSNTERFELKSNINGKSFKLHIALPKDYYKTNKKYPVLYLTDADYLLGIAKNSADMMEFSKLIPEVIIVGIAYEGSFEDWWTRRTQDLTPAPDTTASLFPGGGNADNFLSLIEKQIIPLIESKYRVYKNERAYAGYSLGGLFGTYVLFKKPQLFNRYLLISPSYWWNNKMIYKYESDYAASNKNLNANLVFTAGSKETDMIENIPIMISALESHNYAGLSKEFIKTADDIHYTTFSTAFTKGIQLLYK